MNMYEQVRKNKLKSTWIVSLFIALVNLIGFIVGISFFDNYKIGFVIVNIVTLIYVGITLLNAKSIIMSLNNGKKITKNDNPFIWNTVENLCMVAQLPMPDIYIVEEGSPNAFATGMNPNQSAIGVTTGLLSKLNREEIEAVIAHELAHISSGDSRLSATTIALVSVIILILDIALHLCDTDDNIFGTIALIVAYIFAPIVGQILVYALSRNREYLADSVAVEYCRNPLALVSALEKISADDDPVDNISESCATLYFDEPTKKNIDKPNRKASLFDTHPPVHSRIEKLKMM